MSWKRSLTIAIGCISALLTIVLLSVSIKNVDFDEWGVVYHKVKRTISPDVRDQGKHVLVPGETIWKFTRVFRSVSYSGDEEPKITCFTADGLKAIITMTSQFQILRDELFETIDEFGKEDDLTRYIVAITRDVTRKVCGAFSGEMLFTSRAVMESTLLNALKEEFKLAEVHASAGFVQIENIALPSGFETAINNKQIAEQEKTKALNERAGRIVEAETELRLAEREATIAEINADAEAEGKIKIAEQQALSITKTWTERATAYKQIMDSLGITAEDFVRGYLTSTIIQNSKDSVIGVD